MVNGKKSHYCLNTSTEISRLNALVRGKIVVVELAGWMHDALIKVQKDQVKPWMFHCMEGRSDKFKVPLPEDKELLTSSPIDPAWIQAATAVVIQKVQELIEIVTDSGACPLARVLGILEGPFGPKEGPHAPARASRDASVQASINSNNFTRAQSVPDCMVREIMREFLKRGWEYTYYYEGEATAVAQFGIADYCLITSDDVDARYMLFYSNPATTAYIIYPRAFYQRAQLKNKEGSFWPQGSLLGVLVSDEDFQKGN